MEFYVIAVAAWLMLAGLVAIVKKKRGSTTPTSRYLEVSAPGWIAFATGSVFFTIGVVV